MSFGILMKKMSGHVKHLRPAQQYLRPAQQHLRPAQHSGRNNPWIHSDRLTTGSSEAGLAEPDCVFYCFSPPTNWSSLAGPTQTLVYPTTHRQLNGRRLHSLTNSRDLCMYLPVTDSEYQNSRELLFFVSQVRGT